MSAQRPPGVQRAPRSAAVMGGVEGGSIPSPVCYVQGPALLGRGHSQLHESAYAWGGQRVRPVLACVGGRVEVGVGDHRPMFGVDDGNGLDRKVRLKAARAPRSVRSRATGWDRSWANGPSLCEPAAIPMAQSWGSQGIPAWRLRCRSGRVIGRSRDRVREGARLPGARGVNG
jgi:hypothetical protein